MILLDILSTSLHYFCRKWIRVTNENSNLDFRIKGLKSDKYESYETFKQMMIILYDFSMAVNQNISEKEA